MSVYDLPVVFGIGDGVNCLASLSLVNRIHVYIGSALMLKVSQLAHDVMSAHRR